MEASDRRRHDRNRSPVSVYCGYPVSRYVEDFHKKGAEIKAGI